MSGQVVETARDGNAAWYDLTVRLAKTAPAGYVKEYVMLRTNDPLAPEIPVLVEGQIQPEVVVSPASLFLGVVRPGEKVTKQLVVRSDKPFRVTGVHGDPASLTFSAVSGEAKTLHLIPVTFLAGSEWGKVVKAIHIDTDLQKAPVEAASYAVVAPQQP
jgi:hypothetical protein